MAIARSQVPFALQVKIKINIEKCVKFPFPLIYNIVNDSCQTCTFLALAFIACDGNATWLAGLKPNIHKLATNINTATKCYRMPS